MPPAISLSQAPKPTSPPPAAMPLAAHRNTQAAAVPMVAPDMGPVPISSTYMHGGPTAAAIGGLVSHASHVTGSMPSYQTPPTFSEHSQPTHITSEAYHTHTNGTFQA